MESEVGYKGTGTSVCGSMLLHSAVALLMDAQRIVFGVIGGCIYFTMSGAIKKAQEAKAEKS